MAGLARPNVPDLGVEVPVTKIGNSGSYTRVDGLFDGTQPNEWNTSRVSYWNAPGNYVELSFNQPVNIWRSGTASWPSYTGKLQILKYVNGSYVDVSKNISQTVTAINHSQWEKTISNIPEGRYRFVYTGIRIDSEWYLEALHISRVSFSDISVDSSYIWKDSKEEISIKGSIIFPLPEVEVGYRLLINNTPSSETYSKAFIDQSLPFEATLSIDKFTLAENIISVEFWFDGIRGGVIPLLKIFKESPDTTTFYRNLDTQDTGLSYSNIRHLHLKGASPKDFGIGTISFDIPTEGKSKITGVNINGSNDISLSGTVNQPLGNSEILEEGHVYRSEFLEKYSSINGLSYTVGGEIIGEI